MSASRLLCQVVREMVVDDMDDLRTIAHWNKKHVLIFGGNTRRHSTGMIGGAEPDRMAFQSKCSQRMHRNLVTFCAAADGWVITSSNVIHFAQCYDS